MEGWWLRVQPKFQVGSESLHDANGPARFPVFSLRKEKLCLHNPPLVTTVVP